MRHGEEVAGREEGREHVLRDHHLRAGEAGVGLRGGEDVVLGGVGQAVEEEVDRQEEDAPAGLLGGGGGRRGDFLACSGVVQREGGYAEGDHEDDAVFV